MKGRDEPIRPSKEVFSEAITMLKKGVVPDTLPYVAAYVSDTVKEQKEYADAMTACAIRLTNQNKLLREMATSLQDSVMRNIGKRGVAPQKVKFCGELIPWLAAQAQTEEEKGHHHAAEMLSSAFDAVVMLVAEGRGTVNGA